jgi:type II restriction enzyme
VLAEISQLAAAEIKGLGPAVANIVYFLHATVAPPFNTAMVNGFNALLRVLQNSLRRFGAISKKKVVSSLNVG